MTFREKLADWISGGEFSRLSIVTWEFRFIAKAYEEALSEIAAMETPQANATVKRMAARAREALE
jgi:hypothetical protein